MVNLVIGGKAKIIVAITPAFAPTPQKIATKIRYQTYEIEIEVLKVKEGLDNRQLLQNCSIYLITTYRKNLKDIVIQTLEAGVKIVQYLSLIHISEPTRPERIGGGGVGV